MSVIVTVRGRNQRFSVHKLLNKSLYLCPGGFDQIKNWHNDQFMLLHKSEKFLCKAGNTPASTRISPRTPVLQPHRSLAAPVSSKNPASADHRCGRRCKKSKFARRFARHMLAVVIFGVITVTKKEITASLHRKRPNP